MMKVPNNSSHWGHYGDVDVFVFDKIFVMSHTKVGNLRISTYSAAYLM